MTSTMTSYPTMIPSTSGGSYTNSQPDYQQNNQLVPSYGPETGSNNYYQNYAFATPAATPAYYGSSINTAQSNDPSIYTVPQQSSTTTTDLLNDFLSAPNPPTTRSPTSTMDLPPISSLTINEEYEPTSTATLQARDEAFVASLSPEIIAEQERLYKEIQQRNSMNGRSSSSTTNQQMTLWDPATSSHVAVPRSSNPTGSDAVVPSKYQMKSARKAKMGAGAVGGAVVGGLIFGPAWPLGVVAGGAAGAYGSKQMAKASERRAQRKFEKKNVQQQASQSIVAQDNGAAAFA